MAATPNWRDLIKSVIWSAPVKALESEDIIAAYQGLQEVASLKNPSMPKEVLEGVKFRWGGEKENSDEKVPKRVIRDLKKGWLALTLGDDGVEKSYAMVFSPYWTRETMEDERAEMVKARVVVVEGTEDLPYERQVGMEMKEQLKGCEEFKWIQIEDSPWVSQAVWVMEGEEREFC